MSASPLAQDGGNPGKYLCLHWRGGIVAVVDLVAEVAVVMRVAERLLQVHDHIPIVGSERQAEAGQTLLKRAGAAALALDRKNAPP